MPGMTSSPPLATLTSSDGVSIVYRSHLSQRSRPTVALVHSLAMDHRFWDSTVAHLLPHTNVVAIDARGHGQSGRGTTPYTASRMALDLLEVLNHLGVPKAVVAGASMGGCIALQFAGEHPERTAALGLIDTTAWYGPTAPQDWEGRATKAHAQGLGSLIDFQLTRWFSDRFRSQSPTVVQHSVNTFLANDLEGYMATCRMLGGFDGRHWLPRIQVPTAVVVGEEDYAAPVDMARAMHEGIRGSTLQTIPAARHLTPLEVPETVAAALLALAKQGQP